MDDWWNLLVNYWPVVVMNLWWSRLAGKISRYIYWQSIASGGMLSANWL
jgi:hypothetical protein